MVVTVFDREREFSHEGFYVFDKVNKILMCRYCNTRIEWARRDTCVKHIQGSAGHKKNKVLAMEANKQVTCTGASTSGVKRQISLTDFVSRHKNAKVDKQEFVLSTTRAFMEANIPLEKVDHPKLREWLNKYIEGTK